MLDVSSRADSRIQRITAGSLLFAPHTSFAPRPAQHLRTTVLCLGRLPATELPRQRVNDWLVDHIARLSADDRAALCHHTMEYAQWMGRHALVLQRAVAASDYAARSWNTPLNAYEQDLQAAMQRAGVPVIAQLAVSTDGIHHDR